MDIYSKDRRSEIMSRVRSKNTSIEIILRRYLYKYGFRYRKNVQELAGTPDVVLRKFGSVIFINGCFWHGHKNCKAAKLPSTRTEFWKKKIEDNVRRDKKNYRLLKKVNWKVIIIWQCELSNLHKREYRLNKLIEQISSNA